MPPKELAAAAPGISIPAITEQLSKIVDQMRNKTAMVITPADVDRAETAILKLTNDVSEPVRIENVDILARLVKKENTAANIVPHMAQLVARLSYTNAKVRYCAIYLMCCLSGYSSTASSIAGHAAALASEFNNPVIQIRQAAILSFTKLASHIDTIHVVVPYIEKLVHKLRDINTQVQSAAIRALAHLTLYSEEYMLLLAPYATQLAEKLSGTDSKISGAAAIALHQLAMHEDTFSVVMPFKDQLGILKGQNSAVGRIADSALMKLGSHVAPQEPFPTHSHQQ